MPLEPLVVVGQVPYDEIVSQFVGKYGTVVLVHKVLGVASLQLVVVLAHMEPLLVHMVQP